MEKILNYENRYLNKICEITYDLWGNELSLNKDIKNIIYEYLPRCYIGDNEYSFVYGDIVDSFLLASRKNFDNDSKLWLEEKIRFLDIEEKEIVKSYVSYLDYNYEMVMKHMTNDDIYLALVASTKKGCGTKLIKHLINVSKKNNKKSIYLWTDETCNYEYYEKNKYILVETYYSNLFDKRLKTFIYRLDL